MTVNYDAEKLKVVLWDFYNATGINIVLLRSDFTYIEDISPRANNPYCQFIHSTHQGNSACLQSDIELLEKCSITKKPQTHVCPAGLIDIALPILYDQTILGYILFGGMKSNENFTAVSRYISGLGLDTHTMKLHFNELQEYNSDKIKSISSIAEMLIKYILLENLLKPYYDDKNATVLEYIENNYCKPLSIQSISKNTNISKSVLYKYFHATFNCTVNEYINKLRVEKSRELLITTDYSIEQISQMCGFSSVSYYGRIFKKLENKTPFKFRKEYSAR